MFTGGEVSDIVDKRNKLREKIKANLIAAAASGKDVEGISFMFYLLPPEISLIEIFFISNNHLL